MVAEIIAGDDQNIRGKSVVRRGPSDRLGDRNNEYGEDNASNIYFPNRSLKRANDALQHIEFAMR